MGFWMAFFQKVKHNFKPVIKKTAFAWTTYLNWKMSCFQKNGSLWRLNGSLWRLKIKMQVPRLNDSGGMDKIVWYVTDKDLTNSEACQMKPVPCLSRGWARSPWCRPVRSPRSEAKPGREIQIFYCLLFSHLYRNVHYYKNIKVTLKGTGQKHYKIRP